MNRTQKRKMKTRERIMQVGRSVFLEKGYNAASVSDIMEQADLGHGTFYRHFENKKDLLFTILREFEQKIEEHTNLKIPRDESSIEKRIFIGFYSVFKIYHEYRDVLSIMKEAMAIDEDFKILGERIRKILTEKAERDYRWSVKNGLCRDIDLDTAILSIVNLIHGAGEYIISHSLPESEVERLAINITKLCYHGLFIAESIPDSNPRN